MKAAMFQQQKVAEFTEIRKGCKMTKVRVVAVAIIGIVVLSSCMTVNIEGQGEVPVSMSGERERDYRVLRRFEQTDRAWFTLWDLVTVNDAEVQEVVQEVVENAGGDAAINVAIEGQTTFVDGLIPVGVGVGAGVIGAAINPVLAPTMASLAAAMVTRRTFTVTGDVITYEE